MTPEQARRFGRHIRDAREKLGISARRLADLADVSDSTIVRLEQGAFLEPDPEKLERLAAVLGIDRVELYRLVDYEPPIDALSLTQLVSKRYPTLPQSAVDEITTAASKVLRRHGFDETPVAATRGGRR